MHRHEAQGQLLRMSYKLGVCRGYLWAKPWLVPVHPRVYVSVKDITPEDRFRKQLCMLSALFFPNPCNVSLRCTGQQRIRFECNT